MIEIGKKNLLYGGRYAGKTYQAIKFLADRAVNYREDSYFFRSESAVLKFKAYEYSCNILTDKDINHLGTFNNIKREICFENGCKIYFDAIEGINKDNHLYKFKEVSNVLIDEAEQVKYLDLVFILKNFKSQTIIATANQFTSNLEDFTFNLFDAKKRMTIEDNPSANEYDYKIIESIISFDLKIYLNQRFGLTAKEINNIFKNIK